MQLNMLEAKTQLSKLVEAAMRGEEVIIANRGKPMVRLVKAELPAKKRVWGQWAGLMTNEEVDRAFTPEADAEIAASFTASADRFDPLFVLQPSNLATKAARAVKAAKTVDTRKVSKK